MALFNIEEPKKQENIFNHFTSISDIINEIQRDNCISVTKIAKVINTILDVYAVSGADINTSLIRKRAQVENSEEQQKRIGKKCNYTPSNWAERFAEEREQATYIFYLWNFNFVLKMLNINLKQVIDDNVVERVQEMLYSQGIEVDLNYEKVKSNLNALKNILSKGVRQ